MAAFFVCPRCQSLGLSRRQLADHAVFECRSCHAQFPTASNSSRPDQPTRKDAHAQTALQGSQAGEP